MNPSSYSTPGTSDANYCEKYNGQQMHFRYSSWFSSSLYGSLFKKGPIMYKRNWKHVRMTWSPQSIKTLKSSTLEGQWKIMRILQKAARCIWQATLVFSLPDRLYLGTSGRRDCVQKNLQDAKGVAKAAKQLDTQAIYKTRSRMECTISLRSVHPLLYIHSCNSRLSIYRAKFHGQ